MPQLPSDIILEIVRYLRRPLPPAHTKITDRTLIRQPDLFACLFVCRDWYNTAAPLLYKYAITDDLPSFLFCRRLRSLKPEIIFLPIPGLIPKRELLGFTQRLFIEYAHKDGTGVDKDSDTANLITESLTENRCGTEAEVYLEEGLGLAVQEHGEVRALSDALRLFTGYPNYRRSNPLLQLRTLSIGAIFGHEEETLQSVWRPVDEWADYEQMEREIRYSFGQLVASIPTLEHCCQMPLMAALSFDIDVSLPAIPDGRYSVAYHSNYEHGIWDILTFGVNSRWYSHKSQWLSVQRRSLYDAAVVGFTELALQRDTLAIEHGQTGWSWDISLEIYRSLPVWPHIVPPTQTPLIRLCNGQVHPVSEEDKAAWRLETDFLSKEISVGVERRVRKALPEGIDPVDKVTWEPLFDAPPCEACGWRYEE